MRIVRAAALALAFGLAALPRPATPAVYRSLGAGAARPAADGAPWGAAATARLAADLDAQLAGAATLRGAHAGLLALDARTGAVLYAGRADDVFQPASALKLLVGSVALARLGPAFRFRTTAALTASGGLSVHAGGDPLLTDADLAGIVVALRARRITRVVGAPAIDAGHFEAAPYAPGWSWDDLGTYYAAPIGAASLEENVVTATVVPGARRGDPATIALAPAGASDVLRIAGGVQTAASGSADTVTAARNEDGSFRVSGAIGAGAEPHELSLAVPDGAAFLRAMLLRRLRAAGIAVLPARAPALPPAPATTIWTHEGEPLSDLLADLWWSSDNFVAEALLREIGAAAAGEPGTTAAGIAEETRWLQAQGVDLHLLTLDDGSGLSQYDRCTPRALGAILQADWQSAYRDLAIDDLPLAGARGTLQRRYTGTLADGRVFAKTGSFDHVASIAGYLATLHHGAVTFAFMVDDWMGDPADLDVLRARIFARIIGEE